MRRGLKPYRPRMPPRPLRPALPPAISRPPYSPPSPGPSMPLPAPVPLPPAPGLPTPWKEPEWAPWAAPVPESWLAPGYQVHSVCLGGGAIAVNGLFACSYRPAWGGLTPLPGGATPAGYATFVPEEFPPTPLTRARVGVNYIRIGSSAPPLPSLPIPGRPAAPMPVEQPYYPPMVTPEAAPIYRPMPIPAPKPLWISVPGYPSIYDRPRPRPAPEPRPGAPGKPSEEVPLHPPIELPVAPPWRDDPVVRPRPRPDSPPRPRPQPQPEPEPEPFPGPAPQGGPAPRGRLQLRPRPVPRVRPAYYRLAKPGKRTKERKLRVRAVGAILANWKEALSEADDFVDAFWQALPRGQRGKGDDLHDKLQDLYRNWDKLPPGYFAEALENLIENQIEDAIIGTFDRMRSKAGRQLDRPMPLWNGPWPQVGLI